MFFDKLTLSETGDGVVEMEEKDVTKSYNTLIILWWTLRRRSDRR